VCKTTDSHRFLRTIRSRYETTRIHEGQHNFFLFIIIFFVFDTIIKLFIFVKIRRTRIIKTHHKRVNIIYNNNKGVMRTCTTAVSAVAKIARPKLQQKEKKITWNRHVQGLSDTRCSMQSDTPVSPSPPPHCQSVHTRAQYIFI